MRLLSRWLSFRRDLGLQLFALYLLFVGPVIAAALFFDALAGARLERDARAADLALARSIALETNAALENALSTVQQLAQSPEVLSLEPARLRPLFSAVVAARREVNLVYVLDGAGIMHYHYPEGPGSTVGIDFSGREYYARAQASRDPLMSIGRISPTTQKPVSTAVMPLRNGRGQWRGLVATNLNLEQLSATLAAIASDPETGLRVSIVDSSGQVVADSRPIALPADGAAEFPAELAAMLRGESSSHIQKAADGREWLRSFVPIDVAGWSVVVQRPADLAFASPRAFRGGLLIAIGVFVTGGLFFWMMLSRRVIAPLERLADFSAAISQRAVGPNERARLAEFSQRADQMGHLIRALSRMEQDIERRFAELSTLLETSTAVVSTLDSRRVLDTILEQVERLLGVEMGAIIAVDERTAHLQLRAARGLSDEYDRRIRSGTARGEPPSASIRAIRTRQVVSVANTDTDPHYPPVLRERARVEGYRAIMAAPMITRHAPPSTLVVYWREPHQPTPEEENLLLSYANHAAMAIENAALFDMTDVRLRETSRQLEALVQSLGDGLVLESPDGRVLYFNRRLSELVGLPPDDIRQAAAADLRARLLARAGRPPGEAAQPDLAEPLELAVPVDGREIDLRLQSFEVTDERGTVIGRGQLWLDVTGDKQVDRLKSALIATVSHELRTPLATIKGNITSLLAEDVKWDAAAQREFLQVALDETDQLSALVTDLLDLSRIQAGTFRLDREPAPLRPLVVHAAAQAHPDPGARLHLDLPADLPLVDVDAPRIEAVIRNLLENAAKYAPPPATITVSACAEGDQVIVRVADTGPGIPLEHRDKVFDRFYRVETGLARSAGGAGVGLAICRGFIEAHGRSIWIEPSSSGTTFAFTLPAAAPAPDEVQ